MPVLPSLARIYEDARAAGTASQFTARDLRRLLESAGWSCSDEDWKEGGLRDEAKDAWAKLMVCLTRPIDRDEGELTFNKRSAGQRRRRRRVVASSGQEAQDKHGWRGR